MHRVRGLSVPCTRCVDQSLPPEDDIRWKYPEDIVNSDPELALNRIRWKLGSLEEQETNLNSGTEEHSDILKKIRADHAYLIKLEENAVNALKTF